MDDIDLKSRYDIGWFSAYDTLKGMVALYGYTKVLDALLEIGNLTTLAPDGGTSTAIRRDVDEALKRVMERVNRPRRR